MKPRTGSDRKLLVSAEREFDEFLTIAEERGLGFEIQEFAFPDVMDGDWPLRLSHYRKRLAGFRGPLALHNAYHDLVHVSPDPEILEVARMRYDFHFKLAGELGATILVSHLNWQPLHRGARLKRWQEGEIRFWEPYVRRAEREGLLLVMENIFAPRPELLKPVFEGLPSENFKFNLDLGHAHVLSEVPLEDWIACLGGVLAYMHVHSNDGSEDRHGSLLRGTIDFDRLFAELDRLDLAPLLSTEIYGLEELLESLDYLTGKMGHSRAYGPG